LDCFDKQKPQGLPDELLPKSHVTAISRKILSSLSEKIIYPRKLMPHRKPKHAYDITSR
jgi:hypothetical protein